MSISGPPGPWLTDNENPYTLTCHAYADDPQELKQELKWMGPDGNEVVEDEALTVTNPDVSGNFATVKLIFIKPNASHAGTYSCVSSTTIEPFLGNSTRWNVTIKRESDKHT